MNAFRFWFLFSFFAVIGLNVSAQKPYFIYLQTETQEPFFVQLNRKNYPSSSTGHVILPGLVSGTYTLQAGFPGQNTLQEYVVVITNEDQGYLLKKIEGGGYGIINLQTSAIQLDGAVRRATEEAERQFAAASAARAKQQELDSLAQKKAADDSTAAIKAKAAEDSMNQKNAAGAGVAAAATASVIAANNPEKKSVAGEAEGVKTEQKAGEVPAKQAAGTTGVAIAGTTVAATTGVVAGTLSAAEIARLQEEARRIDAQGKRDSVLNAMKDTTAKPVAATAAPAFLDIELTMPADSLSKAGAVVKADSAVKEADTAVNAAIAGAAIAVATPADSLKNISPAPKPAATDGKSAGVAAATVAATGAAVAAADAPAKNPNCKAEATDADVELVAMLIKGEKQAEDAMDIAKKAIKVKCISTAQARTLCLLFEGQEDRYTFLDMAYRYTTDKQKFGTLSDLLTDPYFLNRFKAMLQ